jgi:hypothetical protein
LPYQEVAESHLTRGPDDKVGVRGATSVQLGSKQLLGDILGRHALTQQLTRGLDDLRPATIVEGDIHDEPVVAAG